MRLHYISVLWKLEGGNIKEKYTSKVEKEEKGLLKLVLKMKTCTKIPFETWQVCDVISSYCSMCVNKTGITGFCSVKLDAAHGPRS